MNGILVSGGRAVLAYALSQLPLHLAWGSGDVAWGDTPPLPAGDATALVAELGRRKPTILNFVAPAEAGAIVIDDGSGGRLRYDTAPGPTPWLHLDVRFDFAEAAEATIRELGVFANTVVNPALPPGQMYFAPAEIVDPGDLIMITRIRPTPRSVGSEQGYHIVLEL